MSYWFYMIPLFGVVGLLFTAIRASWVVKQDAGNERMKEISTYVAEGAMAFLKAEWRILGIYAAIAAVLLVILGMSNPDSSPLIAVAFLTGAVFSATAGYIGMRIATKANVRTAIARCIGDLGPSQADIPPGNNRFQPAQPRKFLHRQAKRTVERARQMTTADSQLRRELLHRDAGISSKLSSLSRSSSSSSSDSRSR